MNNSLNKFERLLIEKRIIKEEELVECKKEAKKSCKPLLKVIETKSPISEKTITETYGKAINIPFINLGETFIPKGILNILPEDLAKKYKAIVFEKNKKGQIYVAMAHPEDLEAVEVLQKIIGQKIKTYIATSTDINRALDHYTELQQDIERTIEGTPYAKSEVELKAPAILDELVKEDAPIPRLVNTIIERAVKINASDIHIEPRGKSVEIRYRIDGVLQSVVKLPKSIQQAVISRIKILCNLKIEETRMPQDGRFSIKSEGKKVDFRVSTLPVANGEKVVMRILDTSSGILTLEQLGVAGKAFNILEKNIYRPNGMILVTGPTGSGKSTTLYAVIDKLNKPGVNIITLEDPIEYNMEGVNQSQVKPEIGYTFASGLRSILRQDPDIVMVGEIRDTETAGMAVHAALTGHIVLSTLHTNDASGAIPRLIDMKVEPFLLASSVNAIIAQRLVRRLCKHCAEKYALNKNSIDGKLVFEEIKNLPDQKKQKVNLKKSLSFYKQKGCQKCNQTGYKGRIGIFEIFSLNEQIKNLVLKKAPAGELLKSALKDGMLTLRQDGLLKALEGITTLEEIWRVTAEE
jgi:type IV pilus assembly protein PilB